MFNRNKFLISSTLIVMLAASCQKIDRPEVGDYPRDDKPLPTGALRFYASFDKTDGARPRDNAMDSISGNPAMTFPLTYETGITGMALKGKANAAALYQSANDIGNATSLTVAFWMKRAVNNNTEFFFSLKDDRAPYSGWSHSSMFMMAEHGTATAATVKVYLMDQWLEFPDANKLQKPMFDGQWHHWAMAYDQTTSKMTYYFDGQPVTNAPASATDVKNGSAPRGALDLHGANNLIIGGMNKHANVAGPTDDWISSFQGDIDQFRMYNKALTAAEVMELYTGKK